MDTVWTGSHTGDTRPAWKRWIRLLFLLSRRHKWLHVEESSLRESDCFTAACEKLNCKILRTWEAAPRMLLMIAWLLTAAAHSYVTWCLYGYRCGGWHQRFNRYNRLLYSHFVMTAPFSLPVFSGNKLKRGNCCSMFVWESESGPLEATRM